MDFLPTRATPAGTPKIISTSVSPRKYSASGATSPTKNHHEGRTGGMSSWYSSSQQSSAGNSPPHGPPIPGRANKIDGKEGYDLSTRLYIPPPTVPHTLLLAGLGIIVVVD
nr:hypothetical protein CTI12_AA502280 [Tanacetum cinerariifolium]